MGQKWKFFLLSIILNDHGFHENIKGILHFLEICSFYNSPIVKLLSFTFFESIQPISGSGGTTFSIA